MGVVRDGDSVTDNGVTYQLAQTVPGRIESTYQNVLTITEPLSSLVSSTFTCQVGNALGPSETSDPLVIPGKMHSLDKYRYIYYVLELLRSSIFPYPEPSITAHNIAELLLPIAWAGQNHPMKF